ncbi:hypothetical protein L195_g042460 [Trifolium pratense]|uniref:Uncharacterized protein n=1 Tax=Trifolium pratense TaxID=57577 RepID=A0A2K3M6F9_TRIPR|nr:hypothetical protein L195_g042460 [Trifolium pratense]
MKVGIWVCGVGREEIEEGKEDGDGDGDGDEVGGRSVISRFETFERTRTFIWMKMELVNGICINWI